MSESSPVRGDDWVGEANAILAGYRELLRPFGVLVAPEVQVIADGHPCPGYQHDDRTIRFCPPVIRGATDRLRWALFVGYMGCTSLGEAADFYRDALPLVVAHETAHHLRITLDYAASSPFVEEQICDRIAVALAAEAHGGAHLARLQRRCEVMRRRLDGRYAQGAGATFVVDDAEALRAAGALGDDDLSALEEAAFRGPVSLDDLVALARRREPRLLDEARLARARARESMDLHYTSDPAAYWHLSLRWLEGYLRRAHRAGLIESLNAHLSPRPGRSPEALFSLQRALHGAHDRGLQEAAAAGLLDALGASVLDDLADLAAEQPGASAALVRAALRSPASGVGGAACWRLARAALSAALSSRDDEAAAAALRLLGRSGAPEPTLAPLLAQAARHGGEAVRREQEAASPGASLAAALRAGEEHLDSWLDALLAWQRPMPEDVWSFLVSRPPSPRVLRLAALHRRQDAPFATVAARLLVQARSSMSPDLVQALLALTASGGLLADSLPRRGTDAFAAALPLLDLTRAPVRSSPVAALRHAAAVADAQHRPTWLSPDVLAAVGEAVDGGAALLDLGAALPEGAAASLARERAAREAQALAAEVILGLCDAREAPSLAALIEEFHGPFPATIRSLLLAALPAEGLDGAALARVERLLDGRALDARREVPSVASAPLRMLCEAILERYPAPDVLTVVERLVLLRAVPLFERVDLVPLMALAEQTIELHLSAGQALFREGDPGDRLFIVQRGEMRVLGRDGVELTRCGQGACLGEVALLDGSPRSATVEAITDCALLALDGAAVRKVGHAAPVFFEALLKVLATRLRQANRH